MCVATAVSAGLAIGGAALNAYGSYQEGQAEADAAKYNIAIAENEIRQTGIRGEEEKSALGIASGQQLATGQTSLAAGNVAVGTGTAADWEFDIGAALEADIASVEGSTRRRVSSLRMQQQLAQQRADSAQRGALFGAGSSILSGAGKVARSFS